MPEAAVNGIDLHYELEGSGEPLVLVHGSWGDATSWRFVVPGLAERFRVLAYDRRGHSRSERPDTPGSVDEDGDDLAALLEALDLAPAHVATNSWGGNIALRLATRRPDVFRSLCCHEPPLWSLLDGDPESQEMLQESARSLEEVGKLIAAGDHEGAARQFVEEVAFGPGAWENELPAELRAVSRAERPDLPGRASGPESAQRRPGRVGAPGGTGPAHGGIREPAGVPAGDRPARRADPARHPRDDPGRSARAPAVDPRALRRGHDARAARSRLAAWKRRLPRIASAWRS